MKKKDSIREINDVPVAGDYDVIVIGGGVAGVGAALAARRNGRSVLIIEKSVMLGGLATLGFIAYYLPLCDGRGRKVIGGFAEELLHLSIKYGYHDLPEHWRTGRGKVPQKRYQTIFSPPEFVFALDELITGEGIDLLFDTLFCAAVMKDSTCKAVIVENKAGRRAYRAGMFIDASGDADLFWRAGADLVEEKNHLAFWFYNTNLKKMQAAVESGKVKKGISLEWRGKFIPGGGYNLGDKEYTVSRAEDVTRFILNGRKLLKAQIEKNKLEKGSLLAIPGMAQFRRTRRIAGITELRETDAYRSFDDSIGSIGHWMKRGIVYEIPYRTLINARHANMLICGRAVSSSDDAWEAVRVIPPAVLTGQAAGTAAALAIEKKCAVQNIPLQSLQQKLQDTGVMLHHGCTPGAEKVA